MIFRDRMEQTSKNRDSKIVLAFDFPFENPENRDKLYSKADRILEVVSPYLCAVKFNHHLVLPLGTFEGVKKLISKAHEKGLPTIMDCKINDIGNTNQVIAQYYYAAGFDALIANPFIGWEEGLKPVFDEARKTDKGVILLVYMSHKAAPEGYGQIIIDPETNKQTPQYVAFAKKARAFSADGAVVGATSPEKIKEASAILGDKVPIYSPGIGTQGGEISSTLKAGARYLIVGRAIIQADDPAEMAREIRDLANAI